MASHTTDNLGLFRENPLVFDEASSDIRTMSGHLVSFILPKWVSHKMGEFETVIMQGTVVYLEFTRGDEVPMNSDLKESKEQKPEFKFDGIIIHGVHYPAWNELKEVHNMGVKAMEFYKVAGRTPMKIIGTETPDAPCFGVLDNVLVRMNINIPPKDSSQFLTMTSVVEEINDACQREVEISLSDEGVFIKIPASWILQDRTAVLDGVKKSKLIPVITKPDAFPSIGSKIFYGGFDENFHGIVKDIDIVSNGSRVQVELADRNDDKRRITILYSNIYGTEENYLNPSIIQTISPKKYLSVKTWYREKILSHVTSQLKKWDVWKISRGDMAMKVLTIKTDKDGKRSPHFIAAHHAIGRTDLDLVSFETGTVSIEGKEYTVVRSDRDMDDNSIVFFDIPKEAQASSLVFNAVIGTAEKTLFSNGQNKTVQSFFSAENGVNITCSGTPIFSSIPSTKRVTVDVVNLKWVLGYPKIITRKGKNGKPESQSTLFWVAVPDQFRNFFTWVNSAGNHSIFKGKTVSEVREMFTCKEFPHLVELFNLMCHGLTDKNPTRSEKWTLDFIRNEMFIDPKDIK